MPNKFRLAAKKLFLTFPNVTDKTITIKEIQARALKIFELESLIVARELHKNQIPHYHVLLCFHKKQQIYNPHFFDFLTGKHGNYTTVRHLKKTIVYITKDKEWISWGKNLVLKTKETTRQTIIDTLKQPDQSPSDLFNLNNQQMDNIIYMEGNKIQTFYKLILAHQIQLKIQANPTLIQWDLSTNNIPEEFATFFSRTAPILEFINKHANNRHYKSPNLLIWSHTPNTGKSSLLNILHKTARCYWWPSDHWYERYVDKLAQFIIWDEFALTNLQPEFLKRLFAGDELQLPIKGHIIHKTDNPLIIAASNHSLPELVKRKMQFSCACTNLQPNQFCQLSPKCNTPIATKSFFDAMQARITTIFIQEPLFPDGRECPELWQKYQQFLISRIKSKQEKTHTNNSSNTPQT